MSTSPDQGLWVEVTCDGNRRYELNALKNQGVAIDSTADLSDGHLYAAYKAGGDAMKRIIETARDQSVGMIAAWTWSTKNWERPKEHADAVFQVTKEFLVDLEKNWLHLSENKDVRLVHGGRIEQLGKNAPEMFEILHRICRDTSKRTGMVVALLMDYSGPDEEERAREMWFRSMQCGIKNVSYQDCLDLPWQGVPFRELDLRIRTGETGDIKHTNAVMSGYTGMETRDIFHTAPLPLYTPEMFQRDLDGVQKSEKRQGI